MGAKTSIMKCYIHNTPIKAGTVHVMHDGKYFCGLDCQMRYVKSLARMKREGGEFNHQDRDFVPTYPSNHPIDWNDPYDYIHF